VEQGFLPIWRRYQRALKQRNKALGTPGLDMAWDGELIHAAEQITELRRNYITKLEAYVDQFVQRLVELEKVTVSYLPGWRQDLSYSEVLRGSLLQDREYGFTRHGPHRAEVVVKIGNRLARDSISRGQQKLLVIALLLAQVALLNEVAFIQPVILIDDLTAELDSYHRDRLLDVLSGLKAQTIMTVTEESSLPVNNGTPIRWFHVEHGKVKES
jgi:DNA replication and repair protein RecF